MRWLVRPLRAAQAPRHASLTEEQLTAEGDKSPGVLLASGYIAGGAIAGILIAFMAGVTADFTDRITRWSTANNPFFEGPQRGPAVADPVRCVLIVLLYLVGRETILAPKNVRS